MDENELLEFLKKNPKGMDLIVNAAKEILAQRAKWRQCSMREAVKHCKDRTVKDTPHGTPLPHHDAAVEWFTDGTAVACMSLWRGPYSEVTPDIDAEPPLWWIYE